MNDASSAAALRDTSRHSAIRSGWPSLIVAALVVGAAVYSFSPRPEPDFPPTQVYPDRVLVNGLVQRGGRLIAVGEQGQILVADAVQGPWRSATIEPQQGLTFARAAFVDDKTAIAVGHDGWIVRSSDRGETWKQVALGEPGSDPLLGVAGPFDGRVFAYGAFGLMMVSDDLGQTWTRRDVVIDDAGAAEPAAVSAPVDPFADPFANFDAEAIGGAGHLNDMTHAADGALILVGERGLLARSTDNGETWTSLGDIYAGSFFGVLSLPSKTLIAFGMRGHAFRSEDLGKTWTPCEIPTGTSLFAGAAVGDSGVLLGGAGNTILLSTDDGRRFTAQTRSGRDSVTALVPLGDGRWLTAGDTGLLIKQADVAAAAGDAS